MKLRGFEKITSFKEVEFPMPERKTKMAAGYDICLPQDVTIKAHTLQMVPTGVKAYMQDDEFFGVHIRSSMAVKKGLALVNNVVLSTPIITTMKTTKGTLCWGCITRRTAMLPWQRASVWHRAFFTNTLRLTATAPTQPAAAVLAVRVRNKLYP